MSTPVQCRGGVPLSAPSLAPCPLSSLWPLYLLVKPRIHPPAHPHRPPGSCPSFNQSKVLSFLKSSQRASLDTWGLRDDSWPGARLSALPTCLYQGPKQRLPSREHPQGHKLLQFYLHTFSLSVYVFVLFVCLTKDNSVVLDSPCASPLRAHIVADLVS